MSNDMSSRMRNALSTVVPLPQHGEHKKDCGDRCLNKDRDIRRAPTRMDAREGRRKIAIESGDEGNPR